MGNIQHSVQRVTLHGQSATQHIDSLSQKNYSESVLEVCGDQHLDLQGEVGADGEQQQLGGFLSAHQHQLQVQVSFDQEALRHQADTRHPAQHWRGLQPEDRRRTDGWQTDDRRMTAGVTFSNSHEDVLQVIRHK